MTTLEDESPLHGFFDTAEVSAFWWAEDATDVIVKMGANGCYIAYEGVVVPALLITTGSGKSFNVYLLFTSVGMGATTPDFLYQWNVCITWEVFFWVRV